ncbi:MAG: alpha/beta hydrolase family protein [Acidimicrobiales bacterium]
MASAGAVLLFPGAGSGRETPALVAIDKALAPLPVVRADFPYRREGRKAPDRPPKLIACVRDEAAALAERTGVDPAAVVLGGRSMGGRICSMAAAEGLACLGLVLVSYPLHPPGRPDRLRVDHFPRLHVPCLFVSGTRDPFAAPAELEEHAAAIPGPVTHVWLDGDGHGLKGRDAEVAAAVAAWVTDRAREGRPPG